MLRFLARRLALLLLTTAVAATLVFFAVQVLPGDIGRTVLGPFAGQEAVAALNRQLGTDRPLPLRYLSWIAGVATGDWGRSFAFEVPVLPLVWERLQRSLILAVAALATVLPLAVLAALAAGRRAGGWLDRGLGLGALALGATPEFVTGVVLLLVFAVWLDWLPVQALAPEGAGALERLRHLALPVLCLSLLLFSYFFRMTRANVLKALGSDYVRTAVLKGLAERTVLWRHVLPNAVVPTIAVAGGQFGWLVGGLVVVETLFRYPGIGSLAHGAALNKDVPLLAGCALAITAVFALGNIAADLAAALLDPRLREAASDAG
ncbi:MAG TPA: ABC transporter permease [Alphaproteobacteria bacterium]|nr:ABC transporter permease [Alphaproteobacteria bacterium]